MWHMARPRKPLLSRARIVACALALVDDEGLQAVTTRRLAAELGVRGPSLYNHFRTKDDILDAVADAVCADVDLSMFEPYAEGTEAAEGAERAGSPDGPGAADWQDALARWARSYRAALAAHPHIVPYLARGPGRRPSQLRMADAVFGALTAAGWSRAQATHIGATMRYFVAGSALGSFARGFVDDAELYARDYPHLDEAHLLAEYQQRVDDGAFETGLRALLAGLAQPRED
ncbi:TetR/AcrR family transcriptional regulator [Streptomyces sp. NPDC054784]